MTRRQTDSVRAACAMASIRTLMQTSLPRWTWSMHGDAGNVSFVAMHDRSIDVILNNQRGEGFVKQVFRLVLAGCSHVGAGSVIDIGANTGYYSMLSAAHGCPVLAIDAQPGCHQWFEAARAANEANASRYASLNSTAGGSQSKAATYFDRTRVRLVTRPVSNSGAPIEIDKWACWVMHKIDVRVRRKRRRRSLLSQSPPPPPLLSPRLKSSAVGFPPPPPPPPPPLAVDPELDATPGKLALRPIDGAGMMRLLPPSERILLAKVDTEGAELGVLHALEQLLPRISNLIVEVAPGWWPLFANRTSRRGESRSRGTVHAAQTADVAAALAIRAAGADQVSRLLMDRDSGGWGFQAALTSNGRHMTSADQMHDFIRRMGNNGYWNQVDIWFAREPISARARRLLCIRRQTSVRAHNVCK